MKVVETGRFLIHPLIPLRYILGKLICYVHASVDLTFFTLFTFSLYGKLLDLIIENLLKSSQYIELKKSD